MRHSASLATVAAVIGILCASAVDASAQELGDLQTFVLNTSVHRGESGPLITQSSSISIGFRNDNVEVFAGSGTLPRPSSHAVVIPYGPSFSEVTSLLNYWFEVVGPSAGEAVPVLVTTVLRARRDSDDSQARAVLHIGEGINRGGVQVGSFQAQVSCPQDSGCTFGEFTPLELRDEPVTVLSSTPDDAHVYQVSLATFAQSSSGSGVGSAHVDLVFLQIDPSYPRHDEFSLAFSAGVGNAPLPVTPVPEPGVRALLLAGLVGLWGFVGRRRHQMSEPLLPDMQAR
jgi:hypothetical protein